MNLTTAVHRIESLPLSVEEKKAAHQELLSTDDNKREAVVEKYSRKVPGVKYQTKIAHTPNTK